mgnify:CR=1 FL=1
MAGLNKYYRRSKISEARFRQLLRCFALDLTASNAAALTGISARSTTAIFLKIRRRLLEARERDAFIERGAVEIAESYFGPSRVRGKRGRGAGGKTIVFGIFGDYTSPERGGRVYTEIVPNCRQKTLRRVIRGHIALEAVIHSDGWTGYDGLVDVGYAKHLRVTHRAHEFATAQTHINGIESFWSFAKRRLQKFNGVPRHTFLLHLKECEWRFNHRREDLYQALLNLLRTYPL